MSGTFANLVVNGESGPAGGSAIDGVLALRLVTRSRRRRRLAHPAVVVIYALQVVDGDQIDLEGMEVPRRLLELPGEPLPATSAGLPLQVEVGFEFLPGETALPARGWRQLAGTGDGLENDPKWGTVIAAPTGDGTGRWLLMHLSKTDIGWTGWLPWAITPCCHSSGSGRRLGDLPADRVVGEGVLAQERRRNHDRNRDRGSHDR